MIATAILFDLDQTLVSGERTSVTALHATCERAHKRYGLDPDALHKAVLKRAEELWLSCPATDYCGAVGLDSWDGLWSEFPGDQPELGALRAWASSYRREAWALGLKDCSINDLTFAQELASTFCHHKGPTQRNVFSDAEPALQELAKKFKLGLVTNGPSDLQRAKLAASGLGHYFATVVVSTEIGVGKPDPRIFVHALAALNVTPDKAVMVGDKLERDVAGAQAAGMKSVWVNRWNRERPLEVTPEAEIKTLAALMSVLSLYK